MDTSWSNFLFQVSAKFPRLLRGLGFLRAGGGRWALLQVGRSRRGQGGVVGVDPLVSTLILLTSHPGHCLLI